MAKQGREYVYHYVCFLCSSIDCCDVDRSNADIRLYISTVCLSGVPSVKKIKICERVFHHLVYQLTTMKSKQNLI